MKSGLGQFLRKTVSRIFNAKNQRIKEEDELHKRALHIRLLHVNKMVTK